MRTRQLFTLMAVMAVGASVAGCNRGGAELAKAQEQRVGEYQVTVLAPGGQFRKGENRMAIEVRRDGEPADAGAVQVSSTMPMPGMPTMVAPVAVRPAGAPGRHEGTISFEMAGGWDMAITLAGGQRAQMKLQVK